MRPDVMRMSLKDRFSHLFAVISGERFLKKQGLGNEVPFFICSYAPQEAVDVARHTRSLVKKLESAGVRALEVNLYDLSITLLKERGIWDRILAMETSVSKAELKELLQGVLDPAERLVPAIAARLASEPHDVLFLSGVGEVLPSNPTQILLTTMKTPPRTKPPVS